MKCLSALRIDNIMAHKEQGAAQIPLMPRGQSMALPGGANCSMQ